MRRKMNTNPPKNLRHRLFVAVPLFALCIGWTLVAGVTHVWQQASVEQNGGEIVAETGERDFVLQNGDRVRLAADARLLQSGSLLRLEEGYVLFSVFGWLDVQAGAWTLSAWSGGFDVRKVGEDVIVAAITTPVLVKNGETVFLLPPRTQSTLRGDYRPFDRAELGAWYAERRAVPLPEHYLRSVLTALRSLAPEEKAPRRAATGNKLFAGQFLLADAAKRRLAEVERMERIYAVEQAAGESDPGELQRLLLMPETADILRNYAGREVRARILARAAERGRAALLLPLFLAGQEEWLLASAHSLLREYAWVMSIPENVGEEMRVMRLLQLPASDHEPEGILDVTADRWSMELQATMEENDATAWANQLLPLLGQEIVGLRQAGFPERSSRFAARILSLPVWESETLSPLVQRSLESIREEADGVDPPILTSQSIAEVPQHAVSSDSSSSAMSVSVAEREQIAAETRAVLAEAGFMFTVRTAVKAQSFSRVEVENIVLGTSAGDRLLQFAYDVENNAVSEILHEGNILPYSLPLTKYVEWVRGK